MKVKSREDLDELKKEGLKSLYPDHPKITVGMATCGIATGARKVFDTLVGFALAQLVMGVLLDAHPVALGHVLETRRRPQRMPAQGVFASRLTVAINQHIGPGFEEKYLVAELVLFQVFQFVEKLVGESAFPHVNPQSHLFQPAPGLHAHFGKFGKEHSRQVVNTEKTEIFEALYRLALACAR